MTPKEDEIFLGGKDKVYRVKNSVITEQKINNVGCLFHICLDKSKK